MGLGGMGQKTNNLRKNSFQQEKAIWISMKFFFGFWFGRSFHGKRLICRTLLFIKYYFVCARWREHTKIYFVSINIDGCPCEFNEWFDATMKSMCCWCIKQMFPFPSTRWHVISFVPHLAPQLQRLAVDRLHFFHSVFSVWATVVLINHFASLASSTSLTSVWLRAVANGSVFIYHFHYYYFVLCACECIRCFPLVEKYYFVAVAHLNNRSTCLCECRRSNERTNVVNSNLEFS